MKAIFNVFMLFIVTLALVSCNTTGNSTDKKKKKGCRRCSHQVVIERVV